MVKEKLKIWLRAVRPFSYPASIIPVILGGVMAIGEGQFYFLYFILSLVAIILIHSGANLVNDSEDFINKVDTKDSFGSSGVILGNLLTSGQVFSVGVILLIIGSLLGLFLSYEKGLVILFLEITGALGGYFYTARPFKLKYKGLGIPLIFLLFGPLPVIGSYYVQTERISIQAFLVSIPIGLLTSAILHANDIRDIYHDSKAGIKTLSIVIGKDAAKNLYYYFLILAYLSILIMSIYKIVPLLSLIVLITIPISCKNIKKLYGSDELNSNIKVLDQDTAKLQAQFGGLLIISIIISFIR